MPSSPSPYGSMTRSFNRIPSWIANDASVSGSTTCQLPLTGLVRLHRRFTAWVNHQEAVGQPTSALLNVLGVDSCVNVLRCATKVSRTSAAKMHAVAVRVNIIQSFALVVVIEWVRSSGRPFSGSGPKIAMLVVQPNALSHHLLVSRTKPFPMRIVLDKWRVVQAARFQDLELTSR